MKTILSSRSIRWQPWGPLGLALNLGLALASLGCSNGDTNTASGSGGSGTTATTAAGTGGGGGTGTSSAGGSGGSGGGGIHWGAAAPMAQERIRHAGTRLKDGRVLVTGGEDGAGVILNTSELYDPAQDTWTQGPPLGVARENHTSVLLADGRVLVIGGGESDSSGLPDGQNVLDSTEIFDPASGAFTPSATLLHGRGHHQSTLLDDGRVLAVGGTAEGGASVLEAESLSADQLTWSPAGSLTEGRSLFGLAHRASDIVVGGGLDGQSLPNSTERFDPSTNTWSDFAAMSTGRVYVGYAPLSDGSVVAAGGIGGPGTFLTTTEIMKADGSAWSAGPAFPPSKGNVVGGTGVTLIELTSGSVLATGAYGSILGQYGPGFFSGVLDKTSKKWEQLSSLDTPRALGPVLELEDHRVLLIGGISVGNAPTSSCSISADPVE